MARIKVLEILEAAGGVLRHVFQIVDRLDKNEFDMTVAISPTRMQDPERDIKRLRSLGVHVEIVPMKRRIAPMADFAALRRATRLMWRDGYDVVHAHSSKAGFVGRAAARLAKVERVLYTPHAFAFQRGGVAGRCYRQLERVGARFGGTIVAVSDSERNLAVENRIVSADRVCVIRNAVEPSPVPTPEERAAARAALGLPEDVGVVGTVGRLAPQKGWDDFVAAAAHVLGERSAVRFVLIGAGGPGSGLGEVATRLGVGDKVLFAGHREDAAGLYAAMDVYVQPSRWEGLAYSVLDAMGRGLPVVASDVPGNIDVVKNGETGLLVPARMPAALAEAVVNLLDNANRREELGRAAREYVLREHRIDDFIASISDLYRGS